MTSVLLVGTGAVGTAAARELVRTPGIDEVLLAARRPKPVAALASMLGRTARMSTFCPGEPLPDGVSVVATAVPSEVDAAVASAAVDAGVPFVAASDAANTVDGLFALDTAATERGVPLVAGCGLAPGLADVLARHAAAGLDRVDEVHVARAGVAGPASETTIRRAVREPALEWRDGRWHTERQHGPELVWFPDPIGARETASVGSSVRLLVRALPELRAASIRMTEPLTRGVRWFRPSPDERWGAALVTVWGARGRRYEPVVYGVRHNTAAAAGAVLALTASTLAGVVPALKPAPAPVGVRSLAELVAPVPFLAELASRGVHASAFEGVGV